MSNKDAMVQNYEVRSTIGAECVDRHATLIKALIDFRERSVRGQRPFLVVSNETRRWSNVAAMIDAFNLKPGSAEYEAIIGICNPVSITAATPADFKAVDEYAFNADMVVIALALGQFGMIEYCRGRIIKLSLEARAGGGNPKELEMYSNYLARNIEG